MVKIKKNKPANESVKNEITTTTPAVESVKKTMTNLLGGKLSRQNVDKIKLINGQKIVDFYDAQKKFLCSAIALQDVFNFDADVIDKDSNNEIIFDGKATVLDTKGYLGWAPIVYSKYGKDDRVGYFINSVKIPSETKYIEFK